VGIIYSQLAEALASKKSTCEPMITCSNQQVIGHIRTHLPVEMLPHFRSERFSTPGHIFTAFDFSKDRFDTGIDVE
jgi:hypothetical protein